jgi:hypothetical protein
VAVPRRRAALTPRRRGERIEGRAVERSDRLRAVLSGEPVHRLRVRTARRCGHVAAQERVGCFGDRLGVMERYELPSQWLSRMM